jgi:hypothetical protein
VNDLQAGLRKALAAAAETDLVRALRSRFALTGLAQASGVRSTCQRAPGWSVLRRVEKDHTAHQSRVPGHGARGLATCSGGATTASARRACRRLRVAGVFYDWQFSQRTRQGDAQLVGSGGL